MKVSLVFLTIVASGCHAFFSYPSLSSNSDSEPKTLLFNATSNLADNLLVLNKTTTADSVGFYLASAFLAYTLLYTYEENNPQSKVDSVFGFFSSNKDKKEKSSNIDKNCDCETYCSNKYYYGEQPASDSNYYYSKRWEIIRSALL